MSTTQFSKLGLKQFDGNGFITVAKFNNSGSHLYYADQLSKNVKCIISNQYTECGIFEGHDGVVWDFDFSKDDLTMITVSADYTIGFFDTINYVLIKQIDLSDLANNIPRHITCNDTTAYVIFNKKRGLLQLPIMMFDIASKTLSGSFDIEHNTTIVKSFDTKLFVGSDVGNLVVYENNVMVNCVKIHDNEIKSIVTSKNKQMLLTSSTDRTVKLHNIQTLELIKQIQFETPINYACFGHSDWKLYVGGGDETRNVTKTASHDFSIKFVKIENSKITNKITGADGPIQHIDKSRDGNVLVTASQDGIVRIYSLVNDPVLEKTFLNDAVIENMNFKKEVENKKITKLIPGMKEYSMKHEKLIDNNTYKSAPLPKSHLKEQSVEEIVPTYTVLIQNLPSDITKQIIENSFDISGEIVHIADIQYRRDWNTNSIIDILTYVRYRKVEHAMNAVEKFDKKPFKQNIINVSFAKNNKK